jgi:hypothetical protein
MVLHAVAALLTGLWLLWGLGWLTAQLLARRLDLDRVEAAATGWLFSAAWVALVQGLLLLVGWNRLGPALWILAGLTLLQLVLLWRHGGAAGPKETPAATGPVSPWLWGLLAGSAGLLLVWPARLGPIHDALDVVAYVRDLVEKGVLVSREAVYSGAPLPAPDPRRGTFHGQLALVAAASGMDPVALWRLLPALLVPPALLALFVAGREILGRAGAALAAAGFFLFLAGISRDDFLRNFAYASRVGWALGWVGWMAGHRWLRTGRRGPLALATLAAPTLMAVHVLSGAQYLAVLGSLALGFLWFRPEGTSVRRGAVLLLAATVATSPVLLARLLTSYRVLNPLFDHPQGLLLLGGGWSVLHPVEILRRVGWPGIAAAVLALGLLRHRRERGVAVLVLGAWLPLLVVLAPPTETLLERLRAHSLTFRLLMSVPTPLLLVVLLRLRGRLTAAVVLLALGLHAAQAVRAWRIPEQRREAWQESAPLARLLRQLEARPGPPLTILSDPLTSYAIPAFTRHHTVSPFHQHSSPTDATAWRRMQEAEAVLNGCVPIRETCRILDAYGVDLVLLNQSFRRYQTHFGFVLSPLSYGLQRAKFAAYPQLFRPLPAPEGLLLFAYMGKGRAKHFVRGRPLPADSLLQLPWPGYRPAVPDTGWLRPPGARAGTLEVVARDPVLPFRIPPRASPPLLASHPAADLLGIEARGPVRPGSPLAMDLYWRRKAAPLERPLEVVLVLVRDPPARWLRRLPFQPLLRRLWEVATGRLYRFGKTRVPLEHFYPPWLWEPGGFYRDRLVLWIPPQALPGRYRVHALVRWASFQENIALGDLLWDAGSYVGPVATAVEIVPREESP